MSESLTYVDALKVLGDHRSRLVDLLDGVLSMGLATWAATGWATGVDASAPMNLFDLKDEVVRFGHEAVRRVGERRSGVSRFDRSQRLAAAHAVLVVSSYFEALEQADLSPAPVLTAGEQLTHVTGDAPPKGYVDLIEGLLSDRLPLPEPHVPYARTRESISGVYERMSRRFATLVKGDPRWEALAARERARVLDAVRELPPTALKAYDRAFVRLSADNREFEVWANVTETRSVGAGLAEVGRLLSEMATRSMGGRPRDHLARGYRAALADPIAATGRAPEWVTLPTLGEAYVSPRCKAAEIRPGDTPSGQEWWDAQPRVPDAEIFLAGYLTSPRAVRAPLVVLGEPGSGKSKLTEVLAARLPHEEFLPVRVELRDVEAESPIHEQIEQALAWQTGERVSFHDLAEAADGALPVVMLDGFDELLQATGVNRYDYLEQVRDFQRRQLTFGRPVAVVVTSRTVVADRVRYPVGSVALQLQPFGDDQVRRWLEIWGRHNADILDAHGLRPLTAEAALAHRDLARQPLLLLMLAIFDATDNALQKSDAGLGQAQLYEALLMDFALREVRKSPRTQALPEHAQRRMAEAELERLAVVALAMFVRGRQSIGDKELDHDLPILLPGGEETADGADAALSTAQRVTGRFYFIHRSEAHIHGRHIRTYEFLHTTFGEFLVAWLTTRALDGLLARPGERDDGLLHAILSFACVAERAPIVDFLAERLGGLAADRREEYREVLVDTIDAALYPAERRSFAGYRPIRLPVTRRLAAYSANLTLLLVLLSPEGTSVRAVFGGAGVSPVERWIEHARLWKAQLPSSEWDGLVGAVRVRARRDDEGIDVELSREDGSPARVLDSVVVSPPATRMDSTDYDVFLSPGHSYEVEVPPATDVGRLVRTLAFLPDWRTALLLLQTVPYLRTMGHRIRWRGDEHSVLPAYLLALLDHSRQMPPWRRAELYEPPLAATGAFPGLMEHVLLRLRDDARTLPVATTVNLLRQAGEARPSEAYLDVINDLWSRHATHTAGGAGIGGRGLIVALVRSLEQRWPDADLRRLAADLRVAAADRHRAATSG